MITRTSIRQRIIGMIFPNEKLDAKRETLGAAAFLALVLVTLFFPAVFGFKTLLTSGWDAPSVVASGAFSEVPVPSHISRTPDPGAPAWQSEPWAKVLSDQYWQEKHLPLWNPYSAYGTPLAAAMQPQPFYPLMVALSLHPSPWTYNLFIIARLLIAGVLTFLFARVFLPWFGSLCAALTFMLTGYFILYLNMPHVSVEILIPALFLSFEHILRRNSWRAVPAGAAAVFLSMIAGMPESVMLSLVFVSVYSVFRILSSPPLAAAGLPRMIKVFAAIAAGFGLSAFLLLPFVEFVRLAHDTHQASNLGGMRTGLIADDDERSLLLYFLPLSFGPVGNSIFSGLSGWSGMRGYWGIVPSLLAIFAMVYATFGVRHSTRGLRPLTAFFGICLTLMLLKRFGSPIINWVGALPISEMIVYVKYDEPLMGFCVAILAGIGAMLVVERRESPRMFVACAASLAIIVIALAGWSLPRVIPLGKLSVVFYFNVIAGLALAVAACTLVSHPRLRKYLAPGVLVLLVGELAFNFIIPCFYVFNSLPPITRNPYNGAPYVAFLKAHNIDHSRVFAREGNLYPNWAGAFGLADVRTLDGMFYRSYIAFIRSFLLKKGDEGRLSGDLADRFTGSGDGYAYDFDTDREQRFLALSSVKYLVTTSEYGYSPRYINEIIAQHDSQKLWGVGRDAFTVKNGKKIAGLLQHPPSHRVSYRTTVDPTRPIFEGTAAIKPAAQDRTSGVQFLLEIKAGGTITTLFQTFLDPRSINGDREGRSFRVDLSEYGGQEIELLFSTDVGPSGSNAYGWAGWAGIQFVSRQPANGPTPSMLKVYEKEVTIYERQELVPRACLFRSAEVLRRSEVLGRLKARDFNLYQTVALSQESLSAEDSPSFAAFAAASPTPCSPAKILHYDSEQVAITAESDHPTILMLNDTNYPGWTVSVNGKPARLLEADYLFRGVALPAGQNKIMFAYEPQSFATGCWISLATFGAGCGIAGAAALRRRRRRRAVTE